MSHIVKGRHSIDGIERIAGIYQQSSRALMHAQWPTQFSNTSEISSTGNFKSVVLKSRRESAHA